MLTISLLALSKEALCQQGERRCPYQTGEENFAAERARRYYVRY